MLSYFILTVALTLLVSAYCSMLEAIILSTTPAEIEAIKNSNKRKGEILEGFLANIGETSSAILSLNTIANTFGATMAGMLYSKIFPEDGAYAYVFPMIMTVGILIFSEIFPKNLGILYRKALQPWIIRPLYIVCILMKPISKSLYMMLRLFTRKDNNTTASDSEIRLLAEKVAKDGLISVQEKDLISNALSLDDVSISEIMTPRTVVVSLEKSKSISEVFKEQEDLAFSRMPVYDEHSDNVVGIVKRRELLLAKAKDMDTKTVADFTTSPHFVPENGSALATLKELVKNHGRLAIVIDEFGSFTGVVTLEDIFEHLIGSEIFETDDIAVDMRELARIQQAASLKKRNMQNKKIHKEKAKTVQVQMQKKNA
ncbi:MAG: hemolysin family protein [Opitutales bacterium]